MYVLLYSIQRQIVPRSDSKQPSSAAATPPAQQGGILVPQGIQHVLINGQLYPIIQTANGTHLLIQQPVGQIQQNGGAPQVFTAQPIQLANTSTAGGTSVPSQSPTIATSSQSTGENTANTTQTQSPVASNSTSQSVTTAVTSSISSTTQAPSASQTTPSKVAVSSNSVTSLPDGTNQINGDKNPPPNPPPTSVTVSPQTQQVLSKIHAQIEALKPKAETDATARQNLNQLQHIQQQIFNQIRQQMQNVQQRANAAQSSTSQSAASGHVTSQSGTVSGVSTPAAMNSGVSIRAPAPGASNSTNLPPTGFIVQPGWLFILLITCNVFHQQK